MRITDREIFTEESQGQIILETGGTTRQTISGAGAVSAASATLTGTVTVGGASDVVAFFGATPVAVQATTATTGTFTAGTGTNAVSGSSWVGNTGTKSYTVSDVVSALKKYGLLSA